MTELPKFWILDGKTPKPVSLHEWTRWFEDGDRVVAQSVIGDDFVSTVFFGIEMGRGPAPLLFETMIFVDDERMGSWCERCSTFDQALEQHAEAVAELKRWHENDAKAAAAKAGR